MSESSEYSPKFPKLPGGPTRLRPIVGPDERVYHPLHPPKQVRLPDGKIMFIAGKEIVDPRVVMNETARKAWEVALTEHPELMEITIENFDPTSELSNPKAGGTYYHPRSAEEYPRITLPKDWKRSLSYPRSPEGRPLLELIAGKIGIKLEDLTDDVLSTFVLLHEAGHSYDHRGKTAKEHDDEREQQMSTLPARNSQDFLRKFPNATQQELAAFLHQYRSLPSEARADEFAASFIRRHMDLFQKKRE